MIGSLIAVFIGLLAVTAEPTIKLTDDRSPCTEDRQRLCSSSSNNEFALLICLQKEASDPKAISPACHQDMWNYKRNAHTSKRFIDQSKKMCDAVIPSICSDGTDIVECLLEHRLEIEDSQCKRYMNSVAQVFFSDYHLIKGFLDKCSGDVNKLKCGVVKEDSDETVSTQAKVISCLERKIQKVSKECRAVLTKKEELSADSFQMDQALFLACQGDRMQMCKDVADHAGQVYNCLGLYKFDKQMSSACRQEIVRRQLITLEDYKIDYGLKQACGHDLVAQNCLEANIASTLPEGFMRTVGLLHCLTIAHENKDERKVAVSSQCLRKVKQVKLMIMGDIELTPSLGMSCYKDVERYCKNISPKLEGGIINCLMLQAETKEALTPECEDELLDFIEVVDPISDYQLNYALMENCGDYISERCEMEQGEGEVMKCLIDLELRTALRESCHLQILSYKYFMSRSIILDKPLFRACEDDAENLCKTEFNDLKTKNNNKPHGAVISCLYHHMFMDGEFRLSDKCIPELKRSVIAQGESANLSPQIVSSCVTDLTEYCGGFEKDRDDYGCLQKHLVDPKYSLTEQCAKEMDIYSMLVAEDVRYDYRLMKACKDFIHKTCNDEMESGTHSKLLVCLVNYKKSLKGECAKHVKELQLVSLYDFKFNKEFVDACNADVQNHCKYSTTGRAISKKQDVMYCLRDRIVKEKKIETTEPLSNVCIAQLRKEFLKQMADLDLDPELLVACSVDLKTTCKVDTMSDKSELMECLRSNENKLKTECREKVFIREVQVAEDPGIDATLQDKCGSAIHLYCATSKGEEVMECLESNLHQAGLGDECAAVIQRRMKSEHSNIRLNMSLQKACENDVSMVCGDVIGKIARDEIEDGEGEIIQCLKKNYNKISVECEDHINLLREQEVGDYTLDPILVRFCKKDIGVICRGLKNDEVESCLREHLMEVKSENCAKQVVRLITEAHSDVNLDPYLLRACRKDIGYLCGRVVAGKGQIIECLQSNEQRDKNALSPTCSHMLRTRVTMWSNALNVAKRQDSALEVMDELYKAVDSSTYKHELLAYLFLSIGLVVVLSFFGGRCTKRSKPQSKLY